MRSRDVRKTWLLSSFQASRSLLIDLMHAIITFKAYLGSAFEQKVSPARGLKRQGRTWGSTSAWGSKHFALWSIVSIHV